MSNHMTTTRNGFRVEDVTFKHARKQSEIENEIERDSEEEQFQIKAPVSLTPEQVKIFYLAKIDASKDSNEKRVYAQTIRWTDELLSTKKKLFALESKEVGEVKDETGIDDIQ